MRATLASNGLNKATAESRLVWTLCTISLWEMQLNRCDLGLSGFMTIRVDQDRRKLLKVTKAPSKIFLG